MQWLAPWFCDPQVAGKNPVGAVRTMSYSGKKRIKIDDFILYGTLIIFHTPKDICLYLHSTGNKLTTEQKLSRVLVCMRDG